MNSGTLRALVRAGCLAVLLSSVGFAALVSDARASVIFNWVCDVPGCNGDPAFSAFLEFSDAAVAAGSFTGVTGNILSAGITSGVGDGFSLNLGDILTGPPGSNEDDFNNIRIVFDAPRTLVTDLIDISAGTNITFDRAGQGRVDFLENTGGNPYFIQFIEDDNTNASLLGIRGQFVRAQAVPGPATLTLIGLGIAGVAWLGRLKTQKGA